MKLFYIILSVIVIVVVIVVIVSLLVVKPKALEIPQIGVYSEWKDIPESKCVYCGDSVTQTRKCSTSKCDGPNTQTRKCTGCKRYIQQYGLRCNVHDPDTDTVWGMPCKYTNGSFTSDPNPSHVYIYNPENKLYYQEKTKKCINSQNQLADCKLNTPDLQWEIKGSDISPIKSDISSRITLVS